MLFTFTSTDYNADSVKTETNAAYEMTKFRDVQQSCNTYDNTPHPHPPQVLYENVNWH